MFAYFSSVLDYSSLFSFPIHFEDPASLYAYSVISFHHNVMWYLVLVIVFVYWLLFKIIKDSSWTVFNKQMGFLRIFYLSPLFLWTFKELSYLGIFFYVPVLIHTYPIAEYIYPKYNFQGTKTLDIFAVFLRLFSRQIVHGVEPPFWGLPEPSTIVVFRGISIERFLDSFLFPITNSGYFYFDRSANYNSLFTYKYSPFLKVQNFIHSTALEVTWAAGPSAIISSILVPSVLLIYSIDESVEAKFSIKVTGSQWFWNYNFANWVNVFSTSMEDDSMQDFYTYEYDSCLIPTDNLTLGERRLLEVDNPLLMPTSTTVRFLITSTDVLHAWAVPALGIKVDAVPGRLSQVVTQLRDEGYYYGQCSEICGVGHGFMPIVVLGLNEERFSSALRDCTESTYLLLPDLPEEDPVIETEPESYIPKHVKFSDSWKEFDFEFKKKPEETEKNKTEQVTDEAQTPQQEPLGNVTDEAQAPQQEPLENVADEAQAPQQEPLENVTDEAPSALGPKIEAGFWSEKPVQPQEDQGRD